MIFNSIELLRLLSNANGAPGFEDEVVEIIRGYSNDFLRIDEDSTRNLYLHLTENNKNKPTVMIDGHSDEVAFMVQSIKANGMIKFIELGGWYSPNVSAQKVRIRNSDGKYIPGIVASKPPHFMTEKEGKNIIEISDMMIDVGASSREEVIENYKIEPGAPIVPDVEFSFDEDNGIMLGKAFDNRLGCGCVIETLGGLKDKDLRVNVVGSISSQEEVGLRGATITPNVIKPDVAIVFEGTPADDTFKDEYEAQAALKKGPQIRHRDNSMIANPRFVKFARGIAKENGIQFQDAVRTGGGTNGGRISLSNYGIPTIVIGVPVRYIHTHYGFAALVDYRAAIEWAVKIIEKLDTNIINSL